MMKMFSMGGGEIVVKNFFLVCVGGLVGGFDVYIWLLQNFLVDMGVVVVIVNYIIIVLIMFYEVFFCFILMLVDLIMDKLLIEFNYVFIILLNWDFYVEDGEFCFKFILKFWGWFDVIMVFFCLFIQYWDGKLIVVIVFGYDGDGVVVLCGIQEVGGIIIVQKFSMVSQFDMLESVIVSGCIDMVLLFEVIVQEIGCIVYV